MLTEDAVYPLLGAYTRSPQWVKSAIGSVYARLPVRMRYGSAHTKYARELGHSDPAMVAAVKSDKLRATLAWALETVPAYREYKGLLGALSDPYKVLGCLPLVSKADIKGDLSAYLSDKRGKRTRLPTFTGGSTAEPMKFFLERGVTRSREFAYTNDFNKRTGIERGELVLALRGRSVPGAGRPGAPLWMHEPIKNQLVLSTDHLLRSNMPEYLAALRRWRPTSIQAFPSALYPLARWLEAHPDQAAVESIRCVHLSSENVYAYQMALFKRVFGPRVFRHYGQSERILFAASLAGGGGYVFWPLYGHLELIGKDGMPITTPGILGEIVGTGFDNGVMPFVRYRTGDLGMWAHDCAAGYPGWQHLAHIEGRLQEFVVCCDGRLVSVCTLGTAHFEDLADIHEMQYFQNKPGELILRVLSEASLSALATERIGRAVEEKTQGGCIVRIERVARIARTERGKLQMLDQRLDMQDYMQANMFQRSGK